MNIQKNALQTVIDRFLELQELKYRDWEEDFVDEDTGDVFTIKRKEIITEETSPEEEQLLEQINSQLHEIDTDTLLNIKKKTLWTELEPTSLLLELYSRGAIEFMPEMLVTKGIATIPEDMEEIPEDYFKGCKSVESIVFPPSLKRIGKGAFSCCDSLIEVRLPDSVTFIDDNAFECCEALISVHIPDSVTEIGRYAFLDCHNLKSIYIGKGVKELKCQVFGRCYNLESVILSEGLEIIGPWVFDLCWRLRGLEIPSTVKTIKDTAFENCYFLTKKYINNSNVIGTYGEIVADIIQDDGLMIKDNQVIYSIDLYESITFPKCITHVLEDAFNHCERLEKFYYEGTINEWRQVVCEPYWWIDIVHCVDGDYYTNDGDGDE